MIVAVMKSSVPLWLMPWMNSCRYPTIVTVAPPGFTVAPSKTGTVTTEALWVIFAPDGKNGLPPPAVIVNGGVFAPLIAMESTDVQFCEFEFV